MEAVILAGGLGTRLRPLTDTRPKPLLPVANRPMLQHILDRLPPEVDRAILASGYMNDMIRSWTEETEHRVDVIVVDEEEPLGTAGAIKNVADELTGDFLCFNGDVLSTAPLENMIESRRERGAMGVLALWQVEDPSHFGVVALDGDKITRFVEKPPRDQAPSELINAGTYCFAHELLDHIEAGRKTSLEHEIFPEVIEAGHALIGQPFQGSWVDCGRPDVYLEAHRLLLDGRVQKGEDARLDGDWEGWACLGHGAVVEPSATVVRSVLLDGAVVEAGARVVDTVLGADVHVGKDARLEGCVVGDRARVAAGEELSGETLDVGR